MGAIREMHDRKIETNERGFGTYNFCLPDSLVHNFDHDVSLLSYEQDHFGYGERLNVIKSRYYNYRTDLL
jgi:hypothetical protein